MSDLGSAGDFRTGEEKGDLFGRCLGRVGPMHGICLDRLSEILADGAFRGICRVGCAHHFPVFVDRIFAFQDLHDNRT